MMTWAAEVLFVFSSTWHLSNAMKPAEHDMSDDTNVTVT